MHFTLWSQRSFIVGIKPTSKVPRQITHFCDKSICDEPKKESAS